VITQSCGQLFQWGRKFGFENTNDETYTNEQTFNGATESLGYPKGEDAVAEMIDGEWWAIGAGNNSVTKDWDSTNHLLTIAGAESDQKLILPAAGQRNYSSGASKAEYSAIKQLRPYTEAGNSTVFPLRIGTKAGHSTILYLRSSTEALNSTKKPFRTNTKAQNSAIK